MWMSRWGSALILCARPRQRPVSLGHALSLRYTRIPDLQRRWQGRQNNDHWHTAYHAGTHSLYVPYIDSSLDMTPAAPGHPERRVGKSRPGGDPNKTTGLVKINL